MQRESHSSLLNMRAIQCNLAQIGRNVSNLSPRAPSVMDGVFLWQRASHRDAVWMIEMHICLWWGVVCGACVAARIHAYRCPLCGNTAKVPAVFVFLPQQSDMLIWKGSAGIIDTEAGWGQGKCRLNTACLPGRSSYLCMRLYLISHVSDPLRHILDATAVFLCELIHKVYPGLG